MMRLSNLSCEKMNVLLRINVEMKFFLVCHHPAPAAPYYTGFIPERKNSI